METNCLYWVSMISPARKLWRQKGAPNRLGAKVLRLQLTVVVVAAAAVLVLVTVAIAAVGVHAVFAALVVLMVMVAAVDVVCGSMCS